MVAVLPKGRWKRWISGRPVGAFSPVADGMDGLCCIIIVDELIVSAGPPPPAPAGRPCVCLPSEMLCNRSALPPQHHSKKLDHIVCELSSFLRVGKLCDSRVFCAIEHEDLGCIPSGPSQCPSELTCSSRVVAVQSKRVVSRPSRASQPASQKASLLVQQPLPTSQNLDLWPKTHDSQPRQLRVLLQLAS